ncbi:MAG: sensor histidine kinase [Planctomycetota bacterium]|jgi:signal transduction histidine kinase
MSLVASGCLRLIELRSKLNKDSVTLLNHNDEYELKLLELIAKQNQTGIFLPLDQRVFIAKTVIKDINKWWNLTPAHQLRSYISHLMGNGPDLLRIINQLPTAEEIKNWAIDRPLGLSIDNQQFVAVKLKVDAKDVLYFHRRDNIGSSVRVCYSVALRHTGINYRIVDGSGKYISGMEKPTPTAEAFLRSSIGGHFPDWQVELYFRGNDIFDSTASKQTAIYLWTGALVVVLILAAGGFATQAVGKQIRLNRLKNDFIATVSHELKTPLSSMRVLVDTLLEGNYEGEKTATDYLHLISKENERLSRLIDNFLTFSRMERNKKAFDIGRVRPAEIAQTAAEAVQTKLIKDKCRLDVSIDEGLPDVSADKDAMVTVLINLLDNAYKYSYDNKRIELRVFREDSFICFLVKDDGIGMTRRQTKKIFDRFYQADSSLSRQAEGTGLGLAIVKFIVDAHKGQIRVDSKVSFGSVFKVLLPILVDKEK